MEYRLGDLVEAGVGLLIIAGSGIIGLRAYLSKYRNITNSDAVAGTATAAISAEHVTLETLYSCITAEVKRLTQTNADLSAELDTLRAHVATLHTENSELLGRIQTLNEQLVRLEGLFLDCTTCPANRRRVEAEGTVLNCKSINSSIGARRRAGETAKT